MNVSYYGFFLKMNTHVKNVTRFSGLIFINSQCRIFEKQEPYGSNAFKDSHECMYLRPVVFTVPLMLEYKCKLSLALQLDSCSLETRNQIEIFKEINKKSRR